MEKKQKNPKIFSFIKINKFEWNFIFNIIYLYLMNNKKKAILIRKKNF